MTVLVLLKQSGHLLSGLNNATRILHPTPTLPCGLKKRPSREVPNLKSDREREHPIVETQDNLLGEDLLHGYCCLTVFQGIFVPA